MVWWEVRGDIAARPRKGEESLGLVSDMNGDSPNLAIHRFPLPINQRGTGLACPFLACNCTVRGRCPSSPSSLSE